MDLKKSDLAELLTLSLHTIDKLIEDGQIPYYRLHGEYFFNREEIENWLVNTYSLQEKILPFGEAKGENAPWQTFGLFRAIHHGDVLSSFAFNDKESCIRTVMDNVGEKLSLDAQTVSEMLLEREQLMPTALGKGIALPHTREFLLSGLFDAVIVVYLQEPLDWGALDNNPVHTLFFVFACDDKRHLNILAKIAHFCSSDKNVKLLSEQKPLKQELIQYIKEWEAHMGSQEGLVCSHN